MGKDWKRREGGSNTDSNSLRECLQPQSNASKAVGPLKRSILLTQLWLMQGWSAMAKSGDSRVTLPGF